MEESKVNIQLTLPEVVESEEVVKLKQRLTALTSYLAKAETEEESLVVTHYRELLRNAIQTTSQELFGV